MPDPTVSAEPLVWDVRSHPNGGSYAERSEYDWCCTATRAGDTVILTNMLRAPTVPELRRLCELAVREGFKRLRFERSKGARPGWHEIDLARFLARVPGGDPCGGSD